MAPASGFDGERHARRLAPVGVVFVATGLLLGGWIATFLVVLGITLLVLACTTAHEGVQLIGPFAVAELRAVARRRRVWMWRVIYVVLCGIALYLSVFLPQRYGTGRRASVSVYTQGFFLGVSGVLTSYLVHLTLSVVAPIAAEEREKQRWEMLLTTDLRNREVLFGKVAGRLPGLFEPLLACLPVFCILPLLGGVSPVLVGCVAVVTLSLVGGGVAAGLFATVTQRTTEKASNAARGLLWGYFALSVIPIAAVGYPPAWTFPTSVGLTSPVELRHFVEWLNAGNPMGASILSFGLGVGRTGSIEDDLITLTRRCAAFWVLIGGLLTLGSVAVLRRVQLDGLPAVGGKKAKVKSVPVRPPVPDRSVAWWTEYGHLSAAQMRVIGRITIWSYIRCFVGSLAALGFCRWWARAYPDAWPYLGTVADVVSPVLLLVWGAVVVLVPLFTAAQVIARERSADTLQGLTLTALSAREIVFQKWLGVIRPLRHVWSVGLCWSAATVVTGGLPWWVALIFLTAAPFLALCFAATGLGFSAHATTPAKAQRNMAIALFGGGYGLSVGASVMLSLIPDRVTRGLIAVVLFTVVVMVQPLLGWLAYRYAARRLEREYD